MSENKKLFSSSGASKRMKHGEKIERLHKVSEIFNHQKTNIKS